MYRVSYSLTTAPDCPSPLKGMKIKSLIRKCIFRSAESTFLTLSLCSAVSFHFSILWFQLFDLPFKKMAETCTLTGFFSCLAKVYPAHFFVIEILKHGTDFSIIFIIIVDCCWFYFKDTLIQTWTSVNIFWFSRVTWTISFTL